MAKLSKRSAGKERESILFVGAIIAFVLVVNIVLAYFSSAFGWYFLATDRKFYTLSGVTDEYFEAINPDGKKVEFYFCMSPDSLRENNTFARIWNWFLRISPIGDAKFVTNEIIPKSKMHTIIAGTFEFCFCVIVFIIG